MDIVGDEHCIVRHHDHIHSIPDGLLESVHIGPCGDVALHAQPPDDGIYGFGESSYDSHTRGDGYACDPHLGEVHVVIDAGTLQGQLFNCLSAHLEQPRIQIQGIVGHSFDQIRGESCHQIISGVPSRNLSIEHSFSILSMQASAFSSASFSVLPLEMSVACHSALPGS